jgi:hypothetical protein
MVMSEEESVVPAMVCSSHGSINTTRPSLVFGTIIPTVGQRASWNAKGNVVSRVQYKPAGQEMW